MAVAPNVDAISAVVFADIALIVTAARGCAWLFRKLHQPAVVGEVIAGIVLGPSVLGLLPGHLPTHIFPAYVRPYLSVLAQLGVVIFMFIVGLELDATLIRGKARVAAGIGLSSLATPFALGAGLAGWLYGSHDVVAGHHVRFLPFALFVGASMSATAFPVLARILTDRGMQRIELGALSLACAALDDLLAWLVLAVVVAVSASSGAAGLLRTLVELLVFVAVMFAVVRPRLHLLVERYRAAGRLTPNLLAVVIVGFLLSSYATSKLGVHAIFGAFIFGAIMPRDGTTELFHEILERLEQVSVLLLLPVFFIITGLGTDVRHLGGRGALQFLAVLAIACAGKFVGTSAAARGLGVRPRRAVALGVLMNTRGLTELIILNVGLGLGVLDQQLFTILVVMAVVTTVLTEPLLGLVYSDKVLARDIAEAERASLGLVDAYRVVLVVDEPERSGPDVDLAVALTVGEEPREVVLSRFTPLVARVEVGGGLVGELADIAEAMGELQTLARRAEEAGVPAKVRFQFSQDLVRDLLGQVEAIEADVLLVPVPPALPGSAAAARADQLLAAAPCQVVALAGDAGRGIAAAHRWVSVLPGGGRDGAAAMATAVRLAVATGVGLTFLESADRREARRIASVVAGLGRAGIRAAAERLDSAGAPPTGAIGLLVAGWEGRRRSGSPAAAAEQLTRWAAVPALVVRADEADDGESLVKLLDRLGQGSASDEPSGRSEVTAWSAAAEGEQ